MLQEESVQYRNGISGICVESSRYAGGKGEGSHTATVVG